MLKEMISLPCSSCRKEIDFPAWDWRGTAAKSCKRFTFLVNLFSFLLDCILVVALAGKGMPGPAALSLVSIILALSGACFIKSALGKKRFWLGLLLSELYIYLIEDTTTIFLFTNIENAYDPSAVSHVINIFVKCAGAAIISVPLFCFSSAFLAVSLISGTRNDVMTSLILALGSVPVVACCSFFIYILTGVLYSKSDMEDVVVKAMIALYVLSMICAMGIFIGATLFKINARTSGSQMSKARSLSKIAKMESFQDEEPPTTTIQEHDHLEENNVNLSPSTVDRNSVQSSAEESMPSIDYDYSGAFRDQGSSTVVSSVGGTAGSASNSHDASSGRSFDNNSHNSQNSSPAAIHPILLENGFKIKVRNPDNQPTKEILLDIYAPPGKLGIVIDKDDNTIFVHSIKEHSSVIDKLYVGDRIIAIDDECIRSKTVKEVSRIVAERNANPTRKLSIIRSIPETKEEV